MIIIGSDFNIVIDFVWGHQRQAIIGNRYSCSSFVSSIRSASSLSVSLILGYEGL
jgi:hypothetical protein